MLYETDAGDLIRFAKRWASLGDAVAEQVERIVDDPLAAAGLRPERSDLEVNRKTSPYPVSTPCGGAW